METKAMSKNTTQEERLDYLVEEFKADSAEYKEIQTPNSTEDKRRILRSLMNIRMPKELSSYAGETHLSSAACFLLHRNYKVISMK